MWALWTILLLVCPLKVLGPSLCPKEPFYFLIAIMKMLGNKNDGTLYTPDDFSPPSLTTLSGVVTIHSLSNHWNNDWHMVTANEDEDDLCSSRPSLCQVCPAETLGCFQLELSVIGLEEGPSVALAVFRLQRLLKFLGSQLWFSPASSDDISHAPDSHVNSNGALYQRAAGLC